jgi:hypothetical protein
VSVFVKLADGRRECGLREVFTLVNLEDGALWLPFVLCARHFTQWW